MRLRGAGRYVPGKVESTRPHRFTVDEPDAWPWRCVAPPLVATQLRGGGGPAGRRRPLLSSLCLCCRLGAGVGVSGICSISLRAGGTDGVTVGNCRGTDESREACRKLASSSLTLLGVLPAALDEDPGAGEAVGAGLNGLRCCLFLGMPGKPKNKETCPVLPEACRNQVASCEPLIYLVPTVLMTRLQASQMTPTKQAWMFATCKAPPAEALRSHKAGH